MEPGVGLEPTFSALQVRCIATYAYPANMELVSGFEPEISPIPRECCTNLSYTSMESKRVIETLTSAIRMRLFRLSYSDNNLERVTGLEPVSRPWHGPILAARRHPHNLWSGAGGSNSYR